jgi:CheY-like chemotaxis protein
MLVTHQQKQREKTVLIIDDEEMNYFSLAAMLNSRGIRSISASNTADAFSVLKTNAHIDVILMDIMMPGIDGFEASKAITSHERFSKIPIIVLSALTTTEDKNKALASGAVAYLTKPVDFDKLIELLNQYTQPKK